jgi:two-component system phosphate regulon sensor histidine kinase PhoR
VRAGTVLLGASIVAAVPAAVFAAWALFGTLPGAMPLLGILAGSTLTAAAVTVAAAAWAHDVALLRLRIQSASLADRSGPLPGRMRLRSTVALDEELDRLVRILTARSLEAERLLHAEEAIIERLPDPLIVLRPDRSVQRANEAARTAFGKELPAVLRDPGLRLAIDRALAQGTTQVADVSLPVPVAREVNATILALAPGRDMDAGQVVAVLSDRTRERAVERMRADFVANASHELRTPLASLIGFIDTLRGPASDDPPAQARFLQIMSEQAARMNRLIDDLLSLSRVELVEHQQPYAVMDLAELVRVAAAGFEPRLQQRGITMAVSIADGIPLIVGDKDQLAQVLQNLLDNALKYGKEGGTIRLDAAVAAAPRWPALPGVVIAVHDDGSGIAREHLPRLTERFYRVDQGRSRAVGGTGLGLAIVKHVVNRHRGQFTIESTVGVGSVFTVWLPVSARQPPPRASAAGSPA